MALFENSTETNSVSSSEGTEQVYSGGAGQDSTKKKTGFRVEFGPSRKDILNFTNQLAVMIRAGISLQDSLESIAEVQGCYTRSQESYRRRSEFITGIG